jgi:DNA-binding Lrp family transcriptional regulator
MIRRIPTSGLDSTDKCIITMLQKHIEGCRIAPLTKATEKSEGAIRWRLLTLEASGFVKAVRERGSTTYFLNEDAVEAEVSQNFFAKFRGGRTAITSSYFDPMRRYFTPAEDYESETYRSLKDITTALKNVESKHTVASDYLYDAVERLLYRYQVFVLQGVRESMGKHTGVSWYLVEKCGSEDKRALISYQDGPRAEWANECFADEVPLWLLHGLLRRIKRRKPLGDQNADDTIQYVDNLDTEYVRKISNQPHYASYVEDADD